MRKLLSKNKCNFMYKKVPSPRQGLALAKIGWLRRKKYLLVQMVLHNFLSVPIFKKFCIWSLYLDFEILICNTSCWCSGKDAGLSPGRPQFKSLHYQGFLQKDLPWKFFKKWPSIRRITVGITSRSQLLPPPGKPEGLLMQFCERCNWMGST